MQKEERLKRFEESSRNPNAVYVLKEAVEYGLTEEELDYLENPLWTPQIMKWILEGLRSGMTLEQVKIYTEIRNEKPVYNAAQMGQYVAGFQSGIEWEELKQLLQPELNARTMGELIKNYLELQKTKQDGEVNRLDLIKTLEMVQGLFERLRAVEKTYQDKQESDQEFIRYLQKEVALSREKERELSDSLDAEKNQKLSSLLKCQEEAENTPADADEKPQKKVSYGKGKQLLRKSGCLNEETGANPEKANVEISSAEGPEAHPVASYLKKVFRKKTEEEQLVELFEKLPEENLVQVRLGIEHGLSVREVMQYAKLGLSANQAEQSRLIIELQKQRREEQKYV